MIQTENSRRYLDNYDHAGHTTGYSGRLIRIDWYMYVAQGRDSMAEHAVHDTVEHEDTYSLAIEERGTRPSLPRYLADRQDEWDELSERDRRLLTIEVLERWTSTLAPEDYTLEDLVRAERRRHTALQTLRQGELTEQEAKMLRYLQRNEGRTVTYLELARYLFSGKGHQITKKYLAGHHGFAAPEIGQIWNLAHHLRNKLEIDPRRPQHLATMRGSGYAWYSAPPALDDGIDYVARERENDRLRAQIRRDFGLIEGEYAVIDRGDGTRSVLLNAEDGEPRKLELKPGDSPSED